MKKGGKGLMKNSLLYEILKRVPIEKSERNRFDSAVVFGHYTADYLLLWALVGCLLTNQVSFIQDYRPFLIIRAVLAIIFVFTRLPFLFLLNKLTIFFEILLALRGYWQLQLATVAVELLMCSMWALTKEQRPVHFDSSLNFKNLLLKQSTIHILLIIVNAQTQQEVPFIYKFVMAAFLSFVLWTDDNQLYYRRQIKKWFIRADQYLLVFVICLCLDFMTKTTYLQLTLLASIIIIFTSVETLVSKSDYRYLLEMHLDQLGTFSQRKFARYFVQVKLMLKSQQEDIIDSYVKKIKQEDLQFMRNFKVKTDDHGNHSYKTYLINTFMIQHLKNYARTSEYIHDLLLFLYSPDSQIFSLFDLQSWSHRRQYERILKNNVQAELLKELEFQRQKKQTKELLSKCIKLRQAFYQELMKEQIKYERTLQIGLKMMQIVKQFSRNEEARQRKAPEAIFLFNKFSSKCLSPYVEFKIPSTEQYKQQTTEPNPQIFVGISFLKYLKILSINSQFKKMSNYLYVGIEKLTLQNLFDEQLQKYIQQIIQKESHKGNRAFKDVDQNLGLLCLRTALGYMVVCECQVKSSYFNWEMCLKINLKPYFFDKPVLMINSDHRILGVSDLARYFGFKLCHFGEKLQKQTLPQLAERDYYEVGKNQQIVKQTSQNHKEAYKITILKHQQSIVLHKEIFVLELQFLKNSFMTSSEHQRRQPDQFAFNYKWDKIKHNYEDQIDIFSKKLSTNVRVDYGQNITQMRVWNEKVDYRENFDEQKDFLEHTDSSRQKMVEIDQEPFYSRVEKKRDETSLSLKLVYILLGFIMLLSLVMLTFMLLQFNSYAVENGANLHLLSKHLQKFNILSKILAIIQIEPQKAGFSPAIRMGIFKAMLQESNLLSQQIFNLNTDLMSTSKGQALQRSINNVNAYINKFLLDQTVSATTSQFNMYTQFALLYVAFIMDSISTWNNDLLSYKDKAVKITIVVSVLTLFFILVYKIVVWRLENRKMDIMAILKKMDNEYLEMRTRQLKAFQGNWLENQDKLEQEQSCQIDEQGKQNVIIAKRVIKKPFSVVRQLPFIFWLGLLILCSILMLGLTQRFNRTTYNYYQLNDYLSRGVAYHLGVWINVHDRPFNYYNYYVYTMVNRAHTIFQGQQFKAYKNLTEDPLVSLNTFYQPFNQEVSFCQKFNPPFCRPVIGKSGGAAMAVDYLTLVLEQMAGMALRQQNIFSHPEYKSIASVVNFYLHQIVVKSNAAIENDFNSLTHKYWILIAIVYATGILLTLSIIGVMIYYRNQQRKHKMYEDVLLTMPFEKLYSIAAFHTYYQKYYKDSS